MRRSRDLDRWLVLVTVILGVLFAWRLWGPQQLPAPNAYLVRRDEALLDGDRLGRVDVSPSVVVFSDYECPACRTLDANLDTLIRESDGALSIVVRHYPGPQNDYSKAAARAAICASVQGVFPLYHRNLFALQDSLGALSWSQIAQRSSVPDLSAFARCLEDSSVTNRLYRDLGSGMALRLAGTPAVIVGTRLYIGALPTSILRRVLASGSSTR